MTSSEVRLPTNRKFGSFFSFVFVIAGGYSYFNEFTIGAVFFPIVATACMLISIFTPGVLHFPNRLWMRFGFLLGRVVSPLVLGFIFFALFTPVAMVTRIAKRDELRLAPKIRPTYWIDKEAGSGSDSFERQF